MANNLSSISRALKEVYGDQFKSLWRERIRFGNRLAALFSGAAQPVSSMSKLGQHLKADLTDDLESEVGTTLINAFPHVSDVSSHVTSLILEAIKEQA